jgi:hypothetical protein
MAWGDGAFSEAWALASERGESSLGAAAQGVRALGAPSAELSLGGLLASRARLRFTRRVQVISPTRRGGKRNWLGRQVGGLGVGD